MLPTLVLKGKTRAWRQGLEMGSLGIKQNKPKTKARPHKGQKVRRPGCLGTPREGESGRDGVQKTQPWVTERSIWKGNMPHALPRDPRPRCRSPPLFSSPLSSLLLFPPLPSSLCPTLHLHSPADSKISWLLCHGSPAGSPCLSLHLKQNHSISALGFCLSSLCICFRPLSKAPCLPLPLVPAWHAHPKPQKPAPSGHSDSMTNIPASVGLWDHSI